MIDTSNLFKAKRQKLNKTVSLRFRFLATIISIILAITVFIAGVSLYEVDNYVRAQTEEFVNVTCDNEAAQINDRLSNMKKSVKIMESYLMDFFTDDTDVADRTFQETVIQNADHMFKDVAKHTSTDGAAGYYFRFDPSISDGTTGLFYSKLNGGEEFLSLEPTDITLYDKDDTEHVGWYWQPYEAGEPIWMNPYYNQNNDTLLISYIIPMYFKGEFFGIVGMDFDYGVLSETVHGIKLYETGFAHLEINGAVVHNHDHGLEEKVYNDPDQYLRTSRKLVNGMTLVLFANYDDMQRIRHDISFKILFTVLVLSALFILVAIFVVKRIVDPLKKLTDASVKLSDGDYDVEIADSDTYEIKLLSTAFENMAKRLREREKQLRLVAHRDSLTGLRNTTSYTAWIARFDEKMGDEDAKFGVIVLDLNDLKGTNDRYGHAVGNRLIVAAAKVIADVFKRSPVFRIGGDEFLVLLQNNDLEHCEQLLEQFEQSCADTFVEEEDVRIPVRVAYGLAQYDAETDQHFADVFKRADNAMYANKSKAKAALT